MGLVGDALKSWNCALSCCHRQLPCEMPIAMVLPVASSLSLLD